MRRGRPVAAVACGTNSTRLLVMDASGGPITREMRVTGVGRGVEATGRLSAQSIDDTVRVLREYRRANARRSPPDAEGLGSHGGDTSANARSTYTSERL